MRTIHRDLRFTWLGLVFALVGCSVSLEPRIQADGPPPNDSQACTTIESCGASCQRCEAPNDRSEPTCDGTACGYSCNNGLACTDNSCSRTVWTFDSLTTDDLTPRQPPNLSLAVRNTAGNPALAIDVASLAEISFVLSICLAGTLDARSLTLSFRVRYDPPLTGGSFVQPSVPSPMNGAYLGQKPIEADGWNSFSFPLSASSFGNASTTMTMQTGTYGGSYTGTIWFDDFKIE